MSMGVRSQIPPLASLGRDDKKGERWRTESISKSLPLRGEGGTQRRSRKCRLREKAAFSLTCQLSLTSSPAGGRTDPFRHFAQRAKCHLPHCYATVEARVVDIGRGPSIYLLRKFDICLRAFDMIYIPSCPQTYRIEDISSPKWAYRTSGRMYIANGRPKPPIYAPSHGGRLLHSTRPLGWRSEAVFSGPSYS